MSAQDCFLGGCVIVDFGGCNDAWYYGGYTKGMIFGPNSAKAFISNVRIGAVLPTLVKGAEHNISGCVFANSVTFDSTSANCLMTGCVVPDYNITDNGIGNSIDIKERIYTPAWTASISNPSLGNGTMKANWTRRANTITVNIELILGSATTLGSGEWRFSLPKAPYLYGSTKVLTCIVIWPNRISKCLRNFQPGAKLRDYRSIRKHIFCRPGTPFAWTNGHSLQFTISYQV